MFDTITANRLNLNFSEANYVIFRPYQKRLALKQKILVMHEANQLTLNAKITQITLGF